MSRKKRILWIGEASFLSTGYSVYCKEVLSRLYATDKFEIAEMASYCHYTDQRIKKIPWKIYTNLPDPNNKDQVRSYESKPTNQFGEWRLEEVLLDFKPDCVFSIRDMWMDCHIAQSPLKPYFNWSWMSPCDSYPQAHEWIDMMINDIDHTFTYSDWAQGILKKEGGGLINLCGTAPAGANKEHFFPIPNKVELRKHYQLKPDVLIVGTVMRNQKRKLFPDLFQAFKQYLDKCKANNNKALWEKSFLLAHTSHPDIGWDIPRIAQEHGIVDKLLFTYACRENKCGYVFISFFQDSKTVCPKCGKPSAGLPHVQTNIEPKVLGQIYNCMDIYVQYSIAEGQGLPQVEAAACGVPVMAVDYSAMETVVRKLKGYPIKVQRLFREAETHAYRAYPDNTDFVDKLYNFFSLPESMRKKKGFDAHLMANKYFNWDDTAKIWENHFEKIEYADWNLPPRLHQPPQSYPTIQNNEHFVTWCIENILGDASKLYTYFALKLIRNLNYGVEPKGFGGIYFNDQSLLGIKQEWGPFDRKKLIKMLLDIVENRNHWEQRRCGMIKEPTPPFIQVANQ